MAQNTLAKFGLGGGTVDTITGLLGNSAVKSAIRPLLDQWNQWKGTAAVDGVVTVASGLARRVGAASGGATAGSAPRDLAATT